MSIVAAMGTTRDGGGRLRRARRLVPVVAVAGAAVAGVVGAVAARGARRSGASADPERSMAGPPTDRPALPARRTAPPAARRRRVAAGPAPEPDIDLDVATRALTALATVDAEPAAPTAPRSPAAASPPAAVPFADRTPADRTPTDRPPTADDPPAGGAAAPLGGNGHAPPPPLPRRGAAAPTPAAAGPTPVAAPPPPPPPPAAAAPAPDPFPAPVDPPVADAPARPAAEAPPPGPRAGRIAGHLADLRRHRVRLVAGVVVVGIGIGASAALAGVGTADGDRPPAAPTTTERATTTTTRPRVSAATVFADAADRLVRAGSFTYAGAVSATDVSHVRPMLWLGVESTVTGEVSLDLGRVHEVAVGTDERASETITAGPAVWGRRTSGVESLPDADYQAVPELSEPDDSPPARGAALLPAWLAAATDATALGRDPAGRSQFAARLPASALGPVERGARSVDGLLTLVVDDDGIPVRIELVTIDQPRFRLAIDITAVGGSVAIEPPGPGPDAAAP